MGKKSKFEMRPYSNSEVPFTFSSFTFSINSFRWAIVAGTIVAFWQDMTNSVECGCHLKEEWHKSIGSLMSDRKQMIFEPQSNYSYYFMLILKNTSGLILSTHSGKADKFVSAFWNVIRFAILKNFNLEFRCFISAQKIW